MKRGFYVCRLYGKGITKILWKVASVRFAQQLDADNWMDYLKEESPKWKDDFFVAEIK